MRRTAVALACATLVLGGCGSERATPQQPGPDEETMSESSESTPAPGAQTPPAQRAVADLARRLDVAEDDVVVEAMEEVIWRDGSLGCAEKGMMYTQALVEGGRITLRVGEQTYEYHAGGSRGPFLCEKPTQ